MSLRQLAALIAPPVCAACRAPLAHAHAPACPACLAELPWIGAHGCRRCGLPHHGGRACPGLGSGFATAWAPLAYEGSARELVRALKFRGALPLGGLMAAQVVANAPPWAIEGCEAVVGVPPARARSRRRGFDPARLLARGIAERLGLPEARCMSRTGPAPHQLGARRAERQAVGRIDVRVTRPPSRIVLLVDDVHTTGATLAACAVALRGAGAERVHAVSYARTL